MKLSVFGCIQCKNKTKFWMIKVIFTPGGRFSCLSAVISTSVDFDAMPFIMTAWDIRSFMVIKWGRGVGDNFGIRKALIGRIMMIHNSI